MRIEKRRGVARFFARSGSDKTRDLRGESREQVYLRGKYARGRFVFHGKIEWYEITHEVYEEK